MFFLYNIYVKLFDFIWAYKLELFKTLTIELNTTYLIIMINNIQS